MKKIIALLLASLMLLTAMAGCKKDADANTPPAGDATTPSENGEVVGPVFQQGGGSFYITADASILVTYDADGTVQKAEAQNSAAENYLASCDDQTGYDCTDFVSNFIKGMKVLSLNEMSYVIIKQNKDSGHPTQNFMTELKAVAETTLTDISSSAKLVVLSADKMDSNNHLDLESAKTLAIAYLGVRNLENFSGDTAPVNGFYNFYIRYDGAEEYVHVNALTGCVGQGDVSIDDSTDPTDPKEPSVTDPTQPQG